MQFNVWIQEIVEYQNHTLVQKNIAYESMNAANEICKLVLVVYSLLFSLVFPTMNFVMLVSKHPWLKIKIEMLYR